MDNDDAEVCCEALENVPRLPSCARRALGRLKAEFWRARESEERRAVFVADVRRALAEAEGREAET